MNLEKNIILNTKILKSILGYLIKKILNLYKHSSISIVPSRWEEPFGRTAMESAAYGCATITSQKGGLLETFDNDLFLNKLSANEILKKISFLIKNPKKLKFYQKKNFNNPIHLIKNLVAFLDFCKN